MNTCHRRYRGQSQRFAFLDVDEFMYVGKGGLDAVLPLWVSCVLLANTWGVMEPLEPPVVLSKLLAADVLTLGPLVDLEGDPHSQYRHKVYAHGKDIAVCRLTANGLLDQTFDGDGKLSIGFDLGGTDDDTCGGMMIDPHGRIVVAGSVALGNAGTEFGVVRLTAAGQADPAFDVDGKAVVSFSNGLPSEAIPTGVCSDSHGSLIVSGIVSQMVGKPPHAQIYGGVARLLVTGAP
ncbi:MAG: hypothetical protein EBT92_17690, partial [Planctomycetes bacterium]|nr:hypothetical protein [Planctomycetota bacterium]